MRYDRGETALDVRTVDVQGVTASQGIFTRRGWLLGWSVANVDPANPVTITLFDGANTNTTVVASIQLPVGAFTTQHPGTPGWPLEQGLFMAVTGGLVTASFVLAEQVK